MTGHKRRPTTILEMVAAYAAIAPCHRADTQQQHVSSCRTTEISLMNLLPSVFADNQMSDTVCKELIALFRRLARSLAEARHANEETLKNIQIDQRETNANSQ
jgi:hypothetical protein